MPEDRSQPGADEIRAGVVSCYSALARSARDGEVIAECDSEAFVAARFGAAGYADTSGLPEGTVRVSLGCGDPVAVAALRPGDTVLDLGSGGGIDVLLPLPDGHVDAVISNCVINLSPDGSRVLAEAFRVLRPGGRLRISDVIADEGLDPGQRAAAERAVGCTHGTLTAGEYQDLLLSAGFSGIQVTFACSAEPGLRSAIVQAQRPAAPEGIMIRPMRSADAGPVLAIYQAGLDTGQASFETVAPSWEAFDRARLPLHRHVAVDYQGQVLGWVAAAAVSERCVYRGVVEHSVYVHPAARRRGIAAALLAALIGSTEAAGIWTIQTGIFPENTSSLRLHQQAGFRVVGTRERVGCHQGRWRDVTFAERRSAVAGTSEG
jgi:L-amino acid N-acyltransferase YncA